MSQFLFFSAIRNLRCVARRYNCVANCDAIPLTGNTVVDEWVALFALYSTQRLDAFFPDLFTDRDLLRRPDVPSTESLCTLPNPVGFDGHLVDSREEPWRVTSCCRLIP